jgi:hypothetical protein
MAKVTGIGGVFFKSHDPAKLREWYSTHMGVDVQPWGGAQFFFNHPVAPESATRFGVLLKPIPNTSSRAKNPSCSTCASTISTLSSRRCARAERRCSTGARRPRTADSATSWILKANCWSSGSRVPMTPMCSRSSVLNCSRPITESAAWVAGSHTTPRFPYPDEPRVNK